MLKIPFVENHGEQCMQTCLKMALAYYFPEREYSFKEINNKMGRKPGKWTIPSQAAVALCKFGLKARCFSSQDFPGDSLESVYNFYKQTFGNDYNGLEKFLDIETYYKYHNIAKSKNLFEVREHNWSDMVNYFNEGSIVIPVIDYNILRGKDGPYVGHFVLIVDINNESVTIHDPDVGPDRKYKKEDFIKAYKTKEIDDDLLVISK